MKTAWRTGILLLMPPMLLASGCAARSNAVEVVSAKSDESDMAFLHGLIERPAITVEDAARALCIREQLPADTTDAISEHAFARKWVRQRWSLSLQEPLDRATFAYMLCKAGGLPRSVNQRWSDRIGLGDRRYALMTCVDEGILAPGSEFEMVSGADVLSALSALDDR